MLTTNEADVISMGHRESFEVEVAPDGTVSIWKMSKRAGNRIAFDANSHQVAELESFWAFSGQLLIHRASGAPRTKTPHEHPLRLVTSSANSKFAPGRIIDTLECGHTTSRPRSAEVRKAHRCQKCTESSHG